MVVRADDRVLFCGWGTNIKRTYSIYRDLGLQLRNKTPKRRVKAKLREDRQTAAGPNDVWAMDFVHDQLATGKAEGSIFIESMLIGRIHCGSQGIVDALLPAGSVRLKMREDIAVDLQ